MIATNTPEPLLTFEDVRKLLTVSESTLKRLIRDEELPVVRISARRIGFRPSDVTAYQEARGAKPAANE